jgi:hypothetical protein
MFGLGGHAYNSLSGAVHATTLSTTGTVRIANVGAHPTSHTDASNPALHVAGSMSVAGHMWVNTGVSSGAFTTMSDRRRKRNIVPMSDSITAGLQPVRYDLLDEDGNVAERDAVGFVAQDVRELDPALVRVDAAGTHSLDYRGIGVHAVVELQRLARLVEEQGRAAAERGNAVERLAAVVASQRADIEELLRYLGGWIAQVGGAVVAQANAFNRLVAVVARQRDEIEELRTRAGTARSASASVSADGEAREEGDAEGPESERN